MLKVLDKISSRKKNIVVIIFVFMIAILFETAQQVYYIKRFNLAENIAFFEVLKTQSYKWFIWILLSFFLIDFTKKQFTKNQEKLNYLKFALVILSLVFICVLLISVVQLLLSDTKFSMRILFTEYITFFTFQKAPIYTLGYISIAIILHFFFTNESLQIKVEELSEVKKTNTTLYKKLIENNDDKTSVLNIKIGNNRKIIPVKDIYWIEADDYCVIVHTNKDLSYTMRSSLKNLELKLADNFLRVHRRAITNMDIVKELNLSNSPKLILQNNTEIPISKSKLKTVKEYLS